MSEHLAEFQRRWFESDKPSVTLTGTDDVIWFIRFLTGRRTLGLAEALLLELTVVVSSTTVEQHRETRIRSVERGICPIATLNVTN